MSVLRSAQPMRQHSNQPLKAGERSVQLMTYVPESLRDAITRKKGRTEMSAYIRDVLQADVVRDTPIILTDPE